METFIKLCMIFIIGGTLGYVIELFFRRIVHKKWINPGFLVGPTLPLYGVGVLALYLLCSIDYSFIENKILRAVFAVFVITATMTAIEYITGLIFIKGLKVKLWDYSDRKGNIQGIICPLFTLFWGLAGAFYYVFVHKHIVNAVNWITVNPVYSFFLGMYFGIMAIDVFYSFHIVTNIRKWAAEHNVVVKFEEFKVAIKTRAERMKEHKPFFLAFRSHNGISNELDDYAGVMSKFMEKNKR